MSRSVEVPAVPRPVHLDPVSTALVVVDMQNDGLHERGWAAHAGGDAGPGRAAAARLTQVLPGLRELGVRVIWVGWGVRPDLANVPEFTLRAYAWAGGGVGLGDEVEGSGHRAFVRDGWGAQVFDQLAVEADDLLVWKQRLSGFWHTELDSVLRGLAVRTVLFAGINLDQCVQATLADASNLGYSCVLLKDCSATNSPDFCEQAALYTIGGCYGYVTTAGEVLTAAEEVAVADSEPR